MGVTVRVATIATSIVAVGALTAGTVAAQTTADAGAYGGSASAEALTINLFGQAITTSGATAELNSSPLAKATATQVLTPVFTGGPYNAETSSVGSTVRDPEDPNEPCNLSDLAQVPGVARSDVACGFALASLNAGGGNARGLGAEVVLEPSVAELLDTLQLGEPVREGSDQLIQDALGPIVEGISGNPVGDLAGDGIETVADVLQKVLSLQATARVVVAPALADVTVGDCLVTAHARAQGVRIELLPVAADAATKALLPADLEAGEPLITITIGAADVTKQTRCTGEVLKNEGNASAVTIRVGTTALLDTLGLAQQETTLEIGQSICLLEDTPLETCVTLAKAGVDANGNPFADGTSVQALKGVNGGIDLSLGRAGATATGAPAPAAAEQLPRTGGPALLPVLGAAFLALAAATRHATRRRP